MKTGYEPIVFDSTLMTGVAEIDDQHRILVNMINEANDRLVETSGRDVLGEIIRDLMSYALYHFETEEALMVTQDYDEAGKQAHFGEHRAFSAKVSELQSEVAQGNPISREDLLSFLNGWLINHIRHTDMRLGRFLNASKD